VIGDGGPSPGFGVIRASVADKPGLPVQIASAGWEGYVQFTGSKSEYGPCALEFAPLGSGVYTITPAEIGISAQVALDAGRVTLVIFAPGRAEPEPAPAQSAIAGRVTNGAGRTILLRGPEGEQSQTIASDESYRFEHLPAGSYTLVIPGADQRRAGLEMDGHNERMANFTLPAPLLAQSVVRGQVPGGAGLMVSLDGPDGLSLAQAVGEDERFEFGNLPAGEYRLRASGPGGEAAEIVYLDGGNLVDLVLTLPAPPENEWQADISDGGPGPGFGVVRVSVEGQPGLPVRIWTTGWEGMVRRAGEKPEYGPFALEFAPLGSGRYTVEPEGLGVQTEATIDGSRVLRITFRRRSAVAAGLPEEPAAAKTMTHYLLLRQLSVELAAFVAVASYAARFQPAVGVLLDEAVQAEHVTIIGADDAGSDTAWLTAKGCQVEVLDEAQAAAILPQRLAADIPY
jgi:hypothetical protein